MLPFLTFALEQFLLIGGAAVDFHSSPDVIRSFCGRCGSPLTYRNAKEPGLIDVMTCSLDDSEAFAPTFHIWVSHKLDWEELSDRLIAYPTIQSSESEKVPE